MREEVGIMERWGNKGRSWDHGEMGKEGKEKGSQRDGKIRNHRQLIQK